MNVHYLWIVLGMAAVAAALATPRRRQRAGLYEPWALEPVATVLSQPEQVLYRRLIEALPHCLVLPQLQLVQVLRFRRGRYDRSVWNRISQLSVDFLIVRPDTSVVAAIELDDASHDRDERKGADARKAHALKSAGIPLIRWNVRAMPDAGAIREAVDGVGAGLQDGGARQRANGRGTSASLARSVGADVAK